MCLTKKCFITCLLFSDFTWRLFYAQRVKYGHYFVMFVYLLDFQLYVLYYCMCKYVSVGCDTFNSQVLLLKSAPSLSLHSTDWSSLMLTLVVLISPLPPQHTLAWVWHRLLANNNRWVAPRQSADPLWLTSINAKAATVQLYGRPVLSGLSGHVSQNKIRRSECEVSATKYSQFVLFLTISIKYSRNLYLWIFLKRIVISFETLSPINSGTVNFLLAEFYSRIFLKYWVMSFHSKNTCRQTENYTF